ncbi:MAG TPA: enoyl-CoA hydratase-related protein [Vicinamibacterales bacterium]|nr:enoyl-CoA hydratase-related protein [Vicinamibacterales bacterium]
MFRHLATRREGPVEYLTLNRPQVRNAFNDEVISELTAWAERARQDGSARVVVLAGEGTVFCAGADAEWMAKTIDYTHEENVRDATRMAQMFEALNTIPAVVVGRIHGAALGGGAGLTAICDVAVAEEMTTFGFTETKLGILPAVISSYVLPKIGVSAGRELFLTGMRFPASRAREIGLVHAVVPLAQLDDTVHRYVAEVLSAAPTGVAAAKALIAEVGARPPAETIQITANAIAAQRVSPDGQEGLHAFLEKRKPHWVAAPFKLGSSGD